MDGRIGGWLRWARQGSTAVLGEFLLGPADDLVLRQNDVSGGVGGKLIYSISSYAYVGSLFYWNVFDISQGGVVFPSSNDRR